MDQSRRSFMKVAGALAGSAVVISRLPEVKAENLPITLPDFELEKLNVNKVFGKTIEHHAEIYGSLNRSIYGGDFYLTGLNVGQYVLDMFTPIFVGTRDSCYMIRDDEELRLMINGQTCINLPMQGERFVFVYLNHCRQVYSGGVAQSIQAPEIRRYNMREL